MKQNDASGDVTAKINGRPVRLRVTLDALVRLEQDFGLTSLAELQHKISNPSTSDLRIIVAAFSEAAGNPVSPDAVGSTAGSEIAGMIVAVSDAFKGGARPPRPEPEKPAQKPATRRRSK